MDGVEACAWSMNCLETWSMAPMASTEMMLTRVCVCAFCSSSLQAHDCFSSMAFLKVMLTREDAGGIFSPGLARGVWRACGRRSTNPNDKSTHAAQFAQIDRSRRPALTTSGKVATGGGRCVQWCQPFLGNLLADVHRTRYVPNSCLSAPTGPRHQPASYAPPIPALWEDGQVPA